MKTAIASLDALKAVFIGLLLAIAEPAQAARATGGNAHAEGYNTVASKQSSHAEGSNTKASGNQSHAEGDNTESSGVSSHAEGEFSKATKVGAHAEGTHTEASGDASHAEGSNTIASKAYSHAEGFYTVASGYESHAEGSYSEASGPVSHAEGFYTKASSSNQHVQGKYNVEDTLGEYAHIVGGGNSDTDRKNIHTLDWQGNAVFAGDVIDGNGNSLSGKVNIPLSSEGSADYGTSGQVLQTNGDGTMEWVEVSLGYDETLALLNAEQEETA